MLILCSNLQKVRAQWYQSAEMGAQSLNEIRYEYHCNAGLS